MNKNREIVLILLILLAGAILRFYHLSQPDMVTDEALYSFRSLGYLDYLGTQEQSTPLQWLDSRPAWTLLSFHDHPPLFFLIQFLFFKLLGGSVLVARLPAAIAGVLAIYLLYLIGKKLFNPLTGLLTAALAALTVEAVWVSRQAVQESPLILLVLLAFYLFCLALEEKKYFIWLGIICGLGFLTKYTFAWLPLSLFIFLLIKKRDLLKSKQFVIGLLLFILLLAPVVTYNLMLYHNFGHFDLQISYALGEKISAWQILPGKPTGGLLTRLGDLLPNLLADYSPLLLLSAILAFVAALISLTKKRLPRPLLLIMTCFLTLSVWLIIIGSQSRFLTMFYPFFCLLAANLVIQITEKIKLVKIRPVVIFSLLIIFELLFTSNTLYLASPRGKIDLTYSNLNQDQAGWGYNQLEKYLDEQMQDKVPAIKFKNKFAFLDKLIKKQDLTKTKKEPVAWLFISDFNISWGAQVWYINRRQVYWGEPWINADNFIKTLQEQGNDYFYHQGFTKFYFVKAVNTKLKEFGQPTTAAAVLEKQLLALGAKAQEIKNVYGQTAFKIYQFK